MKPIIVSGLQPTGNLHVGNYLGAVKNWVALQNSGKYEMYIFVADMHSLTGKLKPQQLREQTQTAVAELLAAGIDPKKPRSLCNPMCRNMPSWPGFLIA